MPDARLVTGLLEGWAGRVKEGAYTPPTGIRIPFKFEDVSREIELRNGKFDFVGIDNSYIQQNGFSAREYPMRIIFTGRDHDQLGTAFEVGLLKKGQGFLEHPLYGSFPVVPIGKIVRRNDLVKAANETIIEVTFSTSLLLVYPAAVSFPLNELEAALGDFSVVAALAFQNAMSLERTVNQSAGKVSVRRGLQKISSSLRQISDRTAATRRRFDDQFRLINDGLDVLIGQPIQLARQLTALARAPAQALTALKARLDGYARLLSDLINSGTAGEEFGTVTRTDRESAINSFYISDHIALSALSGSVESVIETTFTSRPEAQRAAIEIQRQLDEIVEWRDRRITELGVIDIGEGYQAIQEIVAGVTSYLVGLSFELLPERIMTTKHATTAINLCAELYGELSDERLQFFIDTNELTGDELNEIPKDRAIVWYAEAA